MSVKLVSYRQGDQLCLSLCEKPRRQPYVTYVAYVLMSPAVSGTRANSPFFLTRARLLKKTDAGRVAPISGNVFYQIDRLKSGFEDMGRTVMPRNCALMGATRLASGHFSAASLTRQPVNPLTRQTTSKYYISL